MKIYLECTDSVTETTSSGIQRVERNLALHARHLSDARKDTPALLARTAEGYIEVMEASPKGLKQSLGGVHFIALHARSPRRFRRLCNALFTSFNLRPLGVSQWQGVRRFALIISLIIPVYSIALAAFLAHLIIRSNVSPVRLQPGDILIIPGWSWIDGEVLSEITSLSRSGIHIVPLIHDLIPITHPELVLSETHEKFRSRIDVLLEASSLVMTNSRFTKTEVTRYLHDRHLAYTPPVESFRMGIALDRKRSTTSPRRELEEIFSQQPVFLTVATIEPKKNISYLLDAFETLWEEAPSITLVLVGRQGWKSERTCERIRQLIAAGRPLHWFQDIDDNELSRCYRYARALVYPSVIEGFGLPLLEALLHGCPVLASDIPVFREIGHKHCRYFPLDDSRTLANLIMEWSHTPPPRPELEWPNWNESAREFFGKIRNHFGVAQ